MTFLALCGTGLLTCLFHIAVASLAQDMEGVFLGAHLAWIRDVRVLAVTVKTALGLFLDFSRMVALQTVDRFPMFLMGKFYARLLVLRFVDDDGIRGCPGKSKSHRTGKRDCNHQRNKSYCQFTIH